MWLAETERKRLSEKTEKSKQLGEVVRFVITGGVCFLIELAALKIFRDVIGLGNLVSGTLNYGTLIATAIAFLISVIVNYLLCVRWVFDGAGEQGNAQRAGFLITSVIGFFLNLGLMWLFGKLFQEDLVLFRVFSFEVKMYLVSKSMATVIVMVWNYFTKRKILRR